MASNERRSSSESDSSSSLVASSSSVQPDSLTQQSEIMAGNPSMDRFLQRMRSDLMFELRNIQHGERPVTGQNHRESIQQFMDKHMVGRPSTPGHAGKEGNIPANVDSVEQHRPESVVIEVQGIIEQRPVSSILQSAAFRRHLENVIRGSIGTIHRQAARESRPVYTRAPVSSVSSGATSTVARSSPIPTAVTQTLESRPQLSRSESTESVDSFSSARSSVEQEIDSDVENREDENEDVSPVEAAPRSASPRDEDDSEPQQQPQLRPQPLPRCHPQPQRHPQPQLQRHPQPQPQHHPQPQPQLPRMESPRQQNLVPERVTWDEVSRVQRDELVEEISELLHSRLVSSTLDGEFRARLELHVQERLAASGTNGRAVQEQIRRLPPSGVPRNDFSHLGIDAVGDNDLDNISVTSVSAHSVPYTQTNTYLGREIQSLKAQMNEMKNMLKLTFDLQMDIQRAIRQEVAAAMTSVIAQGASASATGPAPPTRPISDTHCLICLERHSDTVLYQCGHMCVCYVCGRDLVSRGHNCPVCRAPIKDVIRAYKTNAD